MCLKGLKQHFSLCLTSQRCFPARVQANVFVPIEDSVSSFPTLITFFTDHCCNLYLDNDCKQNPIQGLPKTLAVNRESENAVTSFTS